VRIDFREPVRAPAPGQAAVLYDGEGWVLGGGWIESAEA
jgi:tRNA-specific 2-thiouridylase